MHSTDLAAERGWCFTLPTVTAPTRLSALLKLPLWAPKKVKARKSGVNACGGGFRCVTEDEVLAKLGEAAREKAEQRTGKAERKAFMDAKNKKQSANLRAKLFCYCLATVVPTLPASIINCTRPRCAAGGVIHRTCLGEVVQQERGASEWECAFCPL